MSSILLAATCSVAPGCLPSPPSAEADVDAEVADSRALVDASTSPDTRARDTEVESVECWFGPYDTYAPPAGSVSLELVGLTPPLTGRQLVWKVTVRSENGGTSDLRYVSVVGGGTEKALSATVALGCYPEDGAREHTLVVESVGVYPEPVEVSESHGPAVAPSPDLLPTTSEVRFTCGEDTALRVVTAPMTEVGYGGSGAHGIYDRGFVFADLACHAELDCCQDTDGDGDCDADTAWSPPIEGAEWSRISWRFFCFALGAPQDPPARWQPTDLFLSDIVLDCGDAGRVTVDPTARFDAPYCEHAGDGDTAPTGCVGMTGAETGLVEQVAVETVASAPPFIESRVDVRLGVDKPALALVAPTCVLRARATGVRGAHALSLTGLDTPDADGAWATGPGVAYPHLDLEALLTLDGDFVCGDHSQVGFPQIEPHADGQEPAYAHHYRQAAE